jgi:hypothetical protein
MFRALVMLAAAVIMIPNALGQTLCANVKPDRTSEGSMSIPEKAFTRQAAERELQKLRTLLGPDGLVVDPPTWETSFVYLEGWYLKRQALEAKRAVGSSQPVDDFCAFIKEKAYVRH